MHKHSRWLKKNQFQHLSFDSSWSSIISGTHKLRQFDLDVSETIRIASNFSLCRFTLHSTIVSWIVDDSPSGLPTIPKIQVSTRWATSKVLIILNLLSLFFLHYISSRLLRSLPQLAIKIQQASITTAAHHENEEERKKTGNEKKGNWNQRRKQLEIRNEQIVVYQITVSHFVIFFPFQSDFVSVFDALKKVQNDDVFIWERNSIKFECLLWLHFRGSALAEYIYTWTPWNFWLNNKRNEIKMFQTKREQDVEKKKKSKALKRWRKVFDKSSNSVPWPSRRVQIVFE